MRLSLTTEGARRKVTCPENRMAALGTNSRSVSEAGMVGVVDLF
jgi:hypothetical protein